LSLNPDASFAEGSGSGAEGSFVLYAATGTSARGLLTARSLDSTLPDGFEFDFRCGNEHAPMDILAPGPAAQRSATAGGASSASAATSLLHFATVAVDTDSPFMSKLFADDTTKASDWIASLFNVMNVMYQRDLQVSLYQGTTFYCTSGCSDPYTGANHVPADQTDLNIFGTYWQNNHAGVARAFAILLSGQEPSTSNSCAASGFASIRQYCQKAAGGSYSVNQVCTNIKIDPHATFDARIVGHEIGHNFGPYHTHCTNVATGGAPTGSNTIDQCYASEPGCYSGPTSCPAAGAGTIMSYCNFTSASGCAAGTQDLLQFHPTNITKLDAYIASAPNGCLTTNDIVFVNGFE